MDAQFWTYLFVGLSFAGYLYIGYMNRVRDTKGFYVAGQGVPAIANGAATAADWMSAASFISMAGLISFMGFDGAIYLMGWTGGYVLLALLLAPYLRKFNKYTVPDFVGERYYSQTARLVAAICAIFVSFTYVAGQMRGVGIVFSRFLGLTIVQGVIVGMVIVAFFAILGGMKGITWTQVAQYCVLIFAYLLPAIFLAGRVTGIPLPQAALSFTDVVPRLHQLQLDLGLPAYATSNRDLIDVFAITLSLMVGTAGLPHVIVRFYTVPTVRAARYSAFWALFFIALLYTTAPALAAFAKLNLIEQLGRENAVEMVKPGGELAWASTWAETGLLGYHDKNGNGKFEFGPGDAFIKKDFDNPNPDSVNEVYIDRDIIVLSTPEVGGLPAPIVGIVVAGGLAAALSTAAGLLLVISSSFAHDIYYHMINPQASEETRVMAGRIAIGGAIVVAGYFGINPPGFVAEVVAFAFGLAAASFFPIIILGIFDKRMNDKGAIAGMIVGIVFTSIMIIGMRSVQLMGTDEALIGPFFGISAQGIGSIGMLLNFAIAFGVSRSTDEPPDHIQEMVENVRIPRGATATQSAH
ncbi:sodium:solute symporter family protein [Anaerolineales bacterium HSG6]|nr:sodium:solute symporter family protein [Anaerolineales bacterium HSG6]MDM8532548.1 sodium:solute symporter family protein [Anaerolineales bacterium HSG25]